MCRRPPGAIPAFGAWCRRLRPTVRCSHDRTEAPRPVRRSAEVEARLAACGGTRGICGGPLFHPRVCCGRRGTILPLIRRGGGEAGHSLAHGGFPAAAGKPLCAVGDVRAPGARRALTSAVRTRRASLGHALKSSSGAMPTTRWWRRTRTSCSSPTSRKNNCRP